MPSKVRVVTEASTSDITVTTTSETVAATLSGVSTARGGEKVTVTGVLVVTVGTAGTVVTVKVRRGTSTSGTQIGEDAAVSVTAANTVAIPFGAEDTPGDVDNASYVATVTVTSATGNSTVKSSVAVALVGV